MNTKRILKILLHAVLTPIWAFLSVNTFFLFNNSTFQNSEFIPYGFLAIFFFIMVFCINLILLVQHMFWNMDEEKPQTSEKRVNEIKVYCHNLNFNTVEFPKNIKTRLKFSFV